MSIAGAALWVGRTPVGHGLFSGRRFAADDEIAEVEGQLIDDPDYESDYVIALDDPWSLEPAEPFRYVNHSCDPNCEFVYDDEAEDAGERLKVWLTALRDIAAGEELTIDYAWPAKAAIPCLCGTARCRGWIVDADDLHLLTGPRKKRLRWIA